MPKEEMMRRLSHQMDIEKNSQVEIPSIVIPSEKDEKKLKKMVFMFHCSFHTSYYSYTFISVIFIYLQAVGFAGFLMIEISYLTSVI